MEEIGKNIELFEIIKYFGFLIYFILIMIFTKYFYLVIFKNCDIVSSIFNIKNVFLDFLVSFLYVGLAIVFCFYIVLLFLFETGYKDVLQFLNLFIASNIYSFLYSFYWMMKYFKSGKFPKSSLSVMSENDLRIIKSRFLKIKGEDSI
ncbi:hypothetical protein [Flavobacterium sp. UBA7680]|uniref:hypothetical protein n=1 Tax=Flavobacterium sp. UBA7680 TaxID=1946559 RepID=UPI0025C05E56|nr:hypothetical protein [Flavobacterium sp. UBA7680]